MTENVVLALGFFDGVHVGHQNLLRACSELAKKQNCKAGVLTFQSHPDSLVFGKTPGYINTLEDRDRLLRMYGIEVIISLPFNREIMQMPWMDFYKLLRDRYSMSGAVCGEDFTFGNRGIGNANLLQQVCTEDNIPCVVVPEVRLHDVTASSTWIRKLLESGKMEEAVEYLGHPHLLSGPVVKGKQLGRTLGIPTANIWYPSELQMLRKGVYACKVEIDGKWYMAVTNVGTRPTVEGEGVNVEPWILDFSGDLYGKTISLWFYSFVRPEKRFDNLQALKAEIEKNGEEVREIFQKM